MKLFDWFPKKTIRPSGKAAKSSRSRLEVEALESRIVPYAVSGDAWVNPVWVPADSPYLTCVGGTLLTMNGAGASYNSEAVWNSGNLGVGDAWSLNGNGYWGSGGGVMRTLRTFATSASTAFASCVRLSS